MTTGPADGPLTDRLRVLRGGLTPTPLLTLRDDRLDLFTKLEFCNVNGSAKDRTALWILQQAITRGEVRAGTTVVESSSGNFALSLASCAVALGVRFVPVIDPNCNRGTEEFLRVLCPVVAKVTEPDGTGGYLRTRLGRVAELLAGDPTAYWPDQYGNPDAAQAHHRFTGGELCDALPRLDYLFVGVGTGGTIAGMSHRVKETFPGCAVIAVDAAGSAIFGAPPALRRIPGLGSSIVPPLVGQALIDDVVLVPEPDAVTGCHDLLREHGVFAGGSTGSVYHAIQRYFAAHPVPRRTPTVAFLCADRGHAYADTVYNPAWVETLRTGEPCPAAA
ncbi:MAG: 2,3-diaminopropionate biosynthesis protein SbnA [Actinophytocola sp.]|uniref:2,3-diaminopropionate biosynthesis protein SbnA n=1 Tax=Actinophytocola sp. TaxID=1872138 RepID=UPI003C72F61B